MSAPKKLPDDQLISLTELAARCVASYIPFELVEHVYPPVPEQLQLRIAFWSFPDNEEDIRLYSCLANSSADEFHRGDQLFKSRAVKDPLQIGFHLSAMVSVNQPRNQFNVAVTFDRRRISSCNCTCTSSAYWCSHVVAVCLFRIHCPNRVSLRAPVSESLTRLQRDQLQKFAQYLISELPQQILPTAQRLLDELLSSQPTTINTVCGAPDPTAGASVNDQTNWYLDEKTLHDNIKKILIKFCLPTPMVFSDVNYLTNSAPPAAAEWSSLLRPLRGREPEGMWNLLSIVREMYRRCDRNAIRLLEIITEECMACDQILVWWFNIKLTLLIGYGSHSGGKHSNTHSNSNATQHACASLCDEIVVLWRLAALNPGLAPDERDLLHAQFTTWHLKILDRVTKCMVTSTSHNSRQQQNLRNDTELFTGFKPAIEACYLDWEDYPIAGITHSLETNPMYHCPFTCFKSDATGVNGQVNSSQAVLTQNVKQFHPHSAQAQKLHQAHQTHKRRCYASSSNSSNDSVHNLAAVAVARVKRAGCDFGNRSSVSSEGFCENEDELVLDDQQPGPSSLAPPIKIPVVVSNAANLVNLNSFLSTEAGTSAELTEKVELTSPSSSASLSSGSSSVVSQTVLPSILPLGIITGISLSGVPVGSVVYAPDFLQPSTSNQEAPIPVSRRSSKDSSTDSILNDDFDQKLPESPKIEELPKTLQDKLPLTSQDPKNLMFSNMKPTEDAWDILFARAEGLHAHGHGKEASILGVRLAEQMLANPPNLMIEIPPPPKKKGKKHINPISHQVSVLASGTLAKCAFLCSVLDNPENYHIGFRVCLFGLEMPRPPASTKPLEVKLANQESDLLALLKKIPMGVKELKVIRDRAQSLQNGTLKTRGEALLPIMLASFIFDALVTPCQTNRTEKISCIHAFRFPTDENLGFEAAVAALGLKANVSEAEHPLLCEGTRRQRGDLALMLLLTYKDEPRKICRIMEKLLDREIHTLIKSTLLPSYYSQNPPTRSQASQMRPDDLEAQQQYQNDLLSEFNGNSRPQSSTSAELEMGMSTLNIGNMVQSSLQQPSTSQTPPQLMPGSLGNISRSKDLRFKGKRAYPSIPNQPSEASAHFMFELAKNVLTKAGGNSSTSLFTQAPTTNSHHGPHRALHMCAFQLGLYALGLHNCVSSNWLSRTYSSHVSWIMGQGMEIGAPAISFLIDTWEGHLTPPEIAGMADRASSRGWDGNMVYPAAELALSVLPHSAALNPNEIQRAILQCKEQSDQMLERACITVEKAAKGGGVYPEVLFQVAKYWYELYLRNTPGGELEPEEQHDYFNVNLMSLIEQNDLQTQQAPPPPQQQAQVVVAGTPQQAYPQNVPALAQIGIPPYAPYSYPCPGIYHQNIPYHGNQMQMYIPPPQFSYPPPPQAHGSNAPAYNQPVPPAFQGMVQPPQFPGPQFQGVPPLVSGPPPGSQPHAQFFTPPPGPQMIGPPNNQQGPNNMNNLRQQPMHYPAYPPVTAAPNFIGNKQRHPHQFSPTQLRYLLSAYNIGMLALETLARRVHDDRPQAKYARNPPYGEDVKWLLRISKRLGTQYLHQFCVCAVNSIVSPFVLHEVAIESAHYLARNNSALVMQHLRSALAPLVQKCQQMYIQCTHQKLYHLTVADYEEFTSTILSARAAFQITPEGNVQFKDWLQSIRRSKSCKKELWTQINTALQNNTK